MPLIRSHVLAIQDNEADSGLLRETWGTDPEIRLTVLTTGTLAMDRLKTVSKRLPNLILLASRFPFTQMAALDILTAIKADEQLQCIPMVVLVGAEDSKTVQSFYQGQAAAVVLFPQTLEELEVRLSVMKRFWLSIAMLPGQQTTYYE